MCHEVDCYFCLTKVKQNGRHRSVQYANVPAFQKRIPHDSGFARPVCPKRKHKSDDSSEFSESSESDSKENRRVRPYSLAELNDLIRELEMPKDKSEMLASRLKERGLAASDVKITFYRSRHERFAQYYAKEEHFVYCKYVNGLFQEFGETYDPTEWRLFIDSSKLSLKAVLLHQCNKKPSIPMVHAVDVKENYDSISKLLNLIQYDKHN